MALKSIIMVVIGIVISIVLIPTLWDSIYTDALKCIQYNSSFDSGCNATGSSSCCLVEVNSSSSTLLKLVPLIFVGAIIIAVVILGYRP